MRKKIYTLLFCALITLSNYAQKYEAENATLSGGASKVANASASGGYYVAQGDGNLSFTLNLAAEGVYNIYIQAAAPNGVKSNNFIIDGASVTFTSDKAGYVKLKVVNILKLAAGSHTLQITKSWGWMNYDYIELEQVDPSTLFNVSKTLVTPNPTKEARKLYQFLYDNYNKKMISGVSEVTEAEWIKTNTGKYPALVGLDYLFCNRGYTWYDENTPFNQGKAWAAKNGIVNFHWHWRDPSRKTEEFYTSGTTFDITKVFDETSAEYKAMIKDIDYVSAQLKRFQTANIPVIWRPLHEAAGGWFWWGAKGAAPCKKLWQVMFNRMVNVNGLRNLIWVWTSQPNDAAWYPGDEYVDIIGRDIYKTGDHTSQILEFNDMLTNCGGRKIETVSECGSLPDADLMAKDGAGWSWYMVWNGDFVRKDVNNTLDVWKASMNSDKVITLDEMPSIKSYSTLIPNPILSRQKLVYTSSGDVSYLTDNTYNTSKWTASDNSWIAVKVNAGATKVFVNWNNPAYPWSNVLAPDNCPNSASFLIDYDILTSSNSTNGADGDWLKADSVRGNTVTARGHLIDFTGATWVKLQIIKGGGELDEFEVFDASKGSTDTWFFPGTSITANTYKGTPPASNFADLINSKHPENTPVMIRGGIGCISSSTMLKNISEYLKIAKNAHFWAIEMGTNDAWGGSNNNVATFKANLQLIIDSCKALGIEPIIARTLAANEAITGWQIHPDYLQAIDDLTAQNKLIAGPDLYSYFLANPSELNGGTDGVHPNATGAASIQRLWAQKMSPLYGGCTATSITPGFILGKGSLQNSATVAATETDTLTLSPVNTTAVTWAWRGANSFSATTSEITLNNLQTTQAGSYSVRITDAYSCYNDTSFTLAVAAKPSKIEDVTITENNDVSIYPNPSDSGMFTVALQNFSGKAKMEIFDLQGKKVYSSVLYKSETTVKADLVKGIYIVKIKNGKEVLKKKIVVGD